MNTPPEVYQELVDSYSHGSQYCRACFTGTSSDLLELGEWRLINNPGYYGSSQPSILILGFSKGANQNKATKIGDFDKVAFAGARHRLQEVLEVLGLMPKNRSIDALMTANENQFGIASLVRCSFCKLKNGTCKTSGDVVPSAFTNRDTLQVIERCTTKHLGQLPDTVRLVLLLGNSDVYIKKTKDIFRRLYRDYQEINEVSFLAGGRGWVYATHPSPGNGHFKSWVTGPITTKSGRKRHLAVEGIRRAEYTSA